MTERTNDEKNLLALRAVHALASEAGWLYNNGHEKAADNILDYLATAKTDSLVLFYEVFTSFNAQVEEE